MASSRSSSSNPNATISSDVARLQRQPRAAATGWQGGPASGRASGGIRSDVFDEEQLTVGLQHPHDFLQGEIGSVHGAQHEGRDDRVDGSIWERQLLRRCVDQPRSKAMARQPVGEAATHRGVWFDQDQSVEVVGVVRQVQAGAGADLDRAAGRSLEQVLAVFAQSALSPTHRKGSYTAAKARLSMQPADDSTCVMSVSTTQR